MVISIINQIDRTGSEREVSIRPSRVSRRVDVVPAASARIRAPASGQALAPPIHGGRSVRSPGSLVGAERGFADREEGMGNRNEGAATPVVLNVYDLTPANDYFYWLGFGVFHSGIEVHGTEYGFGAHDFPSSGVFEVESKSCPGFVYRRSVWLGTTDMSREEFRSFIEKLAGKYHGNTYHLITKNCNHFTDDVCKSLTGKPIPAWVNRLARVGSVFDCLLPESVQVSPVGRVPTQRPISDDELNSISSSIIEDSDNEAEEKHLLPAPSSDLHPVDVPPKLAKDL